MKRLLLAVVLIICAHGAAFAATHEDITSSQAKGLVDKGKVFLLDVRTPDEYRQAHLEGSVLIPMDQVERRLGEIPRDRPILVYCAVGSRSRTVARWLGRSGFRQVYNMKDGIVGWYRNGLPLAR
jgi:rhodanese-related sulfurtransferase